MQSAPALSEVAQSFLELLTPTEPSTSPANISNRLSALRKVSPPFAAAQIIWLTLSYRQLVLLEGIPRSPSESSQIRPLVWKLFLDLHLAQPPLESPESSSTHPMRITAEEYYDLTTRTPSTFYPKITNDTFRTLATDQAFLSKVGEEKLIRILEAFVHRSSERLRFVDFEPLLKWLHRRAESESPSNKASTTPYVQGMNVLASPFLYVLPSQFEAFVCFVAFIEIQAPRYVRPTLEGVHAGSKLVDACLAHLDPVLFAHLAAHHLSAELYAFPSLLTFCAGTPPLEEVIEYVLHVFQFLHLVGSFDLALD